MYCDVSCGEGIIFPFSRVAGFFRDKRLCYVAVFDGIDSCAYCCAVRNECYCIFNRGVDRIDDDVCGTERVWFPCSGISCHIRD